MVDPRLCGNIKGKIVEGQCIICSDPFVFDKNTNQCGCANKGYLLDQVCTPCWDNASPNILLSDCDCNTGFYMSAAKTCTPGVMPDCLNGTLNFATQKCECSKDFLVFDTFYGCICGKQPQIYDPKLDQCVDVVDICINGVLDAVTGVCNCLYSFLKYVDKVIGCACEDPLRSFDVLTQACVLNPCMNGTVNPVDPNLCDCP